MKLVKDSRASSRIVAINCQPTFGGQAGITPPDRLSVAEHEQLIRRDLNSLRGSQLANIVGSLLPSLSPDADAPLRYLLRTRASGLRAGESQRSKMRGFLAAAWLEIEEAARDEIARLEPSEPSSFDTDALHIPAGQRWSWIGNSISSSYSGLQVAIIQRAGALPVCPDAIGANASEEPLPKVQWSVVSVPRLDELDSLLSIASEATVAAGSVWVLASIDDEAWPGVERTSAPELIRALRERRWIEEDELRLGAGLIGIRARAALRE